MTLNLAKTALVACVFGTTNVFAATAVWEFSGTIEDIVDSSFQDTVNPYTGVFNIGDEWTATLVVDLDSPETPTSGLGSHQDAITEGSLTVNSNNFTFSNSANEYINLAIDSSLPHVTMAYQSNVTINDQITHLINFRFFDWSIPVPSTLEELATSFDLSVINDPRITVAAGSGATHTIHFALDSATVTIEDDTPPPPLVYFQHAAISDIDGNGIDEIAFLRTLPSQDVNVIILDAQTRAKVTGIGFFSAGYEPISMTIVSDMNNNGVDEISVMAKNTADGRLYTLTKDGLTGRTIGQIIFDL